MGEGTRSMGQTIGFRSSSSGLVPVGSGFRGSVAFRSSTGFRGSEVPGYRGSDAQKRWKLSDTSGRREGLRSRPTRADARSVGSKTEPEISRRFLDRPFENGPHRRVFLRGHAIAIPETPEHCLVSWLKLCLSGALHSGCVARRHARRPAWTRFGERDRPAARTCSPAGRGDRRSRPTDGRRSSRRPAGPTHGARSPPDEGLL